MKIRCYFFFLLVLFTKNLFGQCSPGGTLNVPANPDVTISSSTCYNSVSMTSSGFILVKSGATLTINGNVTAAMNCGITVENGATLIINGNISANNLFTFNIYGSASLHSIQVGSASVFNVTSTGNLSISGNIQTNISFNLNIDSGGILTVNGDASINYYASSVDVDGAFVIGGNYTGPSTPTGNGAMCDNDQIFLTPTTLSSNLSSGDLLWKGGASGSSNSWHSASNWYKYNGSSFVANTTVPSATTNVVIANQSCFSVTIFPSTLTTNANAKSVTIKNNASLTVASSKLAVGNVSIESGATLTVATGTIETTGNWTNSGTYMSGTGLVEFKGTSTQTIEGNSQSSFYSLKMNNTNSGTYPNHAAIKLLQNTSIIGLLTLTDGILDVFDKNLTLGSSSSKITISPSLGSADSYIAVHHNIGHVGNLIEYVHASGVGGSSSYYFPIGDDAKWTPFSILFNTGTNISNAAYITTHVNDALVANSSNSAFTNRIVRDWEVEPSGITTPNYNITIYHYGSNLELGGSATSTTVPFKYSAGTLYAPTNANGVNTSSITEVGTFAGSANDFTWSGLNSFSNFGGTQTNSALPVELLDIQTSCEKNGVLIKWVTASEHNSSHFDVLNSRDGNEWKVAKTIAAAGFSNDVLAYSFLDQADAYNAHYYKLVQYDLDGQFVEYGISSVNCKKENEFSLLTYPNPSNGNFTLQISTSEQADAGIYTLNLRDISGRVMNSQKIEIEVGNTNFYFNDLMFKTGYYTVELINELGIHKITRHAIH